MKQKLIDLISHRIMENNDALKNAFQKRTPEIRTRFVAIDNLLPESIAQEIYQCFPDIAKMRVMKSFRERKYTLKQLDQVPTLLKDITFALQDPQIISLIERITGFANQVPDPSLYAGGLSAMAKGNFLNPHIDNSHNDNRAYYRTLNLLFYVTPGWKEEFGGNLELWNGSVKRAITIPSLFNRLVLMETNRNSWHSVSPVTVDNMKRCCVSNYYFSKNSPENYDYFNVTSFSARPNQKARRMAARVDNLIRNGMRKIRKFGFGKKDLYQNK